MIEISTFSGRHPIISVHTGEPVQDSVFGSSAEDPNDFPTLEKQASDFIYRTVMEEGFPSIHLYITGLTQGTTSFLNAWISLNCPCSLILYHYDRYSETYVPQDFTL